MTLNWQTQLAGWRGGGGARAERLADVLIQFIQAGVLRPGDRLPAERVLALEADVSRGTVVAAYERLRVAGWIESRRGSSSRVRAPAQPEHAAARSEVVSGLAQSQFHQRMFVKQDQAIDFTLSAPPVSPEVQGLLQASPSIWEPNYHPLGLPALRGALAGHLSAQGVPTRPEQLLVTSGAQQGITLSAMLYVERGDHVAVEDPTYFGALDALRLRGARFSTISVRRDGVDTDALRRLVQASAARLVYLTPDYHNPTGAVMPRDARLAVARLAAETGIPVLEDRTLAALRLDGPALPSIAAFEEGGTVITVGSFSKTVWAGLRVGWLRAPAPVISQLARLKATLDLGTSFGAQAMALTVLNHFEMVIQPRQTALRHQRDHLAALLQAHLPNWSWEVPPGGLFAWVQVSGIDTRVFAQAAQRQGVLVSPGPDLSASEAHADHLRLSFALDEASLTEGVARLARTWHAYGQ